MICSLLLHHLSRPDVLKKLLVHCRRHAVGKKTLNKKHSCGVVEAGKKLNLGRTQLHNSTMVLFQKFFPHWELRSCGVVELRTLKLLA